ncbi:MAG TPA: sigma-70 family RNA polymerase sigma factor [Acidobacteriota bacterium]|nr:sigma-70 family RNA polymerase sigma factor [Acidobacteriota bacterium]
MTDSEQDAILLPLLEAGKEREEAFLSEILVTHAEPVIKKIVHYRLGVSADRVGTKESWDAADVCGNAMMRLLSHLSKFTKDPREHPIRDFRGYAAVVAHHACNQYFRDKFPRRTQLQNKLRYLLNHNPNFGIWKEKDELVCGLTQMRNQPSSTRVQEFVSQLKNLRLDFSEQLGPAKLSSVLKDVFQMVGSPILLEDLVKMMVNVLGIQEQKQQEPKDSESILEQIEDRRVDAATEMEQRLYLKRLWNEMIDLPLRQRIALLLSVRDSEGSSVLYLFPMTGVTSILEIAKSLSIPAEDFADLWSKLPLEDNGIAERLGITRQQVINLRRSARERLARRMKHQ